MRRIIFQLVKQSDGTRTESMASTVEELPSLLKRTIHVDDHENMCVLVLMESVVEGEEMMEITRINKDWKFSFCPLMTVKTFITLGEQQNVAA